MMKKILKGFEGIYPDWASFVTEVWAAYERLEELPPGLSYDKFVKNVMVGGLYVRAVDGMVVVIYDPEVLGQRFVYREKAVIHD